MSRTGIKSVSTKKSSSKSSSDNPKLKSPPSHPSYFEMIKDAITSLKERTGSSSQAISKFISEKEKANLTPNYKRFLSLHLKRAVASGKLVKVKNSFKLSSSSTPSSNKNTAKTTTSTTQKKPTAGKRTRSSFAEDKSKSTKSKSTKVVSKNKPVVAKKSKKPVAKKPKSLKVASKRAKKA